MTISETASLVADIATSLGVLFGIVSVVFLWLQIRHSIRDREASLCVSLASVSSSPEFTSAVFAIRQSKIATWMDSPAKVNATQVCVFFELVGSICNHGYMSHTLVEQFYGSLVVEMYGFLLTFITTTREQSGNDQFAKNFELLAKRLASARRKR